MAKRKIVVNKKRIKKIQFVKNKPFKYQSYEDGFSKIPARPIMSSTYPKIKSTNLKKFDGQIQLKSKSPLSKLKQINTAVKVSKKGNNSIIALNQKGTRWVKGGYLFDKKGKAVNKYKIPSLGIKSPGPIKGGLYSILKKNNKKVIKGKAKVKRKK